MIRVYVTRGLTVSCPECGVELFMFGPGMFTMHATQLRIFCAPCETWVEVTQGEIQRELDETPSLTREDVYHG